MAKAKKHSKSAPSASHLPIKPLGDRVVIKPLSQEEMGMKTPSGILIPDSAQKKSGQGRVVAVGPGKFDDGMRIPMSVKVGDKVVYSEYSGAEGIKMNGDEYFIVTESNILAVLN